MAECPHPLSWKSAGSKLKSKLKDKWHTLQEDRSVCGKELQLCTWLARMWIYFELLVYSWHLSVAHTKSYICSLFFKQEHARNACNKLHPCGHMCGGIKGEGVCLPCLHGCSSKLALKQDADDMCMICFTEALSCAPAIQVKLWKLELYLSCV